MDELPGKMQDSEILFQLASMKKYKIC
jgi:hypothetical protein